jgi:hypothetical protein
MNEFDLADLACIKESNLSIAKDLIDIKFLLRRILEVLEKIEIWIRIYKIFVLRIIYHLL